MKRFHFRSLLMKAWAFTGIGLAVGSTLFLFAYIFAKGSSSITWEFLSEGPRGAVLGSEGGILPAITGSLWFTGTAVVLGGIPAIFTALFMVFYCPARWMKNAVRLVIECMSGIPSIVLGLFSYSFLVRDLRLGRCILSAGAALAVMIMPFIEVRAEKAFEEVSSRMIRSSYALGCSKFYTITRIVLPMSRGELVSAVILGACYAMGATAPMIFTGAVAFAASPSSVLSPAMALPLHLYLLIAQGATSLPTAYGTAFVMMAIILCSNLIATLYARRLHKKWTRS